MINLHGSAYQIEEVGRSRCWYCGRLSAGGRLVNVDSQLVVQKYKLLVTTGQQLTTDLPTQYAFYLIWQNGITMTNQ